ncbi:MAG: rRNA maturation RNase YbeY [Verrucomicrobiota bacterium]
MTVTITNRQRKRKINSRLLKKIVGTLLTELEIQETELGINLVAAPKMALVNETFLQHKGSTDVITFDYRDKTEGTFLRGELFVCVDEAFLQALKYGTNWQSEVVRYIVHGVLHLLGHEDHQIAARRKMKCEENRLLRGLSHRFPLSKL